jgi:hypothetical protein
MDYRLRRHSGESRNPGFEGASAARPILDAGVRRHDVVFACMTFSYVPFPPDLTLTNTQSP